MTQRLSNQQGQGLIEIIITVLIITFVSLALLRLQTNITYGNSVSQQQNTALTLATNQIETLRDFSALNGIGSYQAITSGTNTYHGASATYIITWTITNVITTPYKTIDVSVTWIDRNDVAQSIRLVTRVAGIDPSYSSSIMG